MLDEGNIFLPNCSFVTLDETVGERKVFYRLGESEIFTYANKNSMVNGQHLIDVIPRMCVDGQGFIQIGYDKLDKTVQYELFTGNRYKISCKKQMVDLIERGKVVLVYSEEYKIPTSIPYIVQTNGKDARIFVNISDFVVMDDYGTIKVQQIRNYNGLMAIIFAACVAYVISSSVGILSADLSDSLVLMHSGMLEKSINSIIHMDPITRDKVRYLCTEFTLIQMYGTNKGTELFQRYKQKYFPKLSNLITDSIDNTFHIDAFDKLSLFIEELATQYPSMKGLTMYMVYDKWIRLYGASTAMSVDYVGYHLYTLCMTLFESPLVVRMALEPLLDKSKGTAAYKRLQMMIESHA